MGEETDSFSSEAALVSEIIANWISSESNSFRALTEVESPNGIADLVFFKLRQDWVECSVLGSVPPRWAYLLSCLPTRRVFGLDFLSTVSGSSERRAREAAEQFVSLGICKRASGRDTWLKDRKVPLPLSKVVALEAKLKDWRRALLQASRYKAFANQSWVVMDGKYAAPAIENIPEFARRNVGLATLSSNGKLSTMYTPVQRRPHDPMSQWFVNAGIIGRIL